MSPLCLPYMSISQAKATASSRGERASRLKAELGVVTSQLGEVTSQLAAATAQLARVPPGTPEP